jgi:hypothetical protein
MAQSLKYTDRPYGRRAPEKPRIPAHAQPIATAPTNTSVPIRVFEPSGRNGPALYFKNAWHELQAQRDPYTGATKLRMNGNVIHNPTHWTSS